MWDTIQYSKRSVASLIEVVTKQRSFSNVEYNINTLPIHGKKDCPYNIVAQL